MFSLCEFVKLWGKWFLITKKHCFFSGMAALFCILVHSWGIGPHHQKKFRQHWWTHGSRHRSCLPSHWQTLLGDLQQTGVSGVSSLGSLESLESQESLESLELTMGCNFSPSQSHLFTTKARYQGKWKIAADKHQAGVHKNLNPAISIQGFQDRSTSFQEV